MGFSCNMNIPINPMGSGPAFGDLQALSRPPSARDLDNLCWALAAVRGFGVSMLIETIQGAELWETAGGS